MLNKILFMFFLFLIGCDAFIFDQNPPEVVGTFPVNNGLEIPVDAVLSVSFSEGMDRESVERAVSLIENNETQITGIYSWSGNRLIFTPIQPLRPAFKYSLTVDNSAEDKNGNNLLETKIFKFSTVGHGASPEVIWNYPQDGDLLTVNTNSILIGFSTNMNVDSLHTAFSISPSVSGIITLISNDTVLSFMPTSPLVFGTIYTIDVSKEALDFSGNTLSEEKNIVFTVGNDFTSPNIISFATQGGTPLMIGSDVITNISKSSSFVFSFSEVMDVSSTKLAFSITPAVDGELSVVGTNLTFMPYTSFQSETLYKVTINDTATDLQENTLESDSTIFFKTDAPDSRYLSVIEIRGQTNELWSQNQAIPLSDDRLTNLSILFSAPVSHLTILPSFSIALFSGANPTAVEFGNISFESNGCLMRFNVNKLGAENIYKFVITSEGEDVFENPLKNEWIFFFQT